MWAGFQREWASKVSADFNGSCNCSTSLKTSICKVSCKVKHAFYQRFWLQKTPGASGGEHVCVQLLFLSASGLGRWAPFWGRSTRSLEACRPILGNGTFPPRAYDLPRQNGWQIRKRYNFPHLLLLLYYWEGKNTAVWTCPWWWCGRSVAELWNTFVCPEPRQRL